MEKLLFCSGGSDTFGKQPIVSSLSELYFPGKSSTLKEIITQKDLPLEVQCAGHADETKFGPLERTSLFTLKLLNVYDDFYLLGNAICYGES